MTVIALVSKNTLYLSLQCRDYWLQITHHLPPSQCSGSSHGNTTIFIKNNLQHHEAEPNYIPSIQASVIFTPLNLGYSVNITSIYCLPRNQIITNEYKLFQHLDRQWIAEYYQNQNITYGDHVQFFQQIEHQLLL